MKPQIPQDYHVHSDFSCDCKESMLTMCRQALDLGIPEIGFSDHYDLMLDDPCYGFFRAEAWWEELEACRRRFQGDLKIRAGVEIGEPHRFPAESRQITDSYPWDYITASLHWVDQELIFDPHYFQKQEKQAYGNYFRGLGEMISDSEFDILAHMDIIKRYGFEAYGGFQPLDYESQIQSVLEACASRGIALEINTSTVRRSIQETSPTRTSLKWFRELGGKWVTLGSDAHYAEHVGHGLDLAMAEAQAAGFRGPASFTDREPSLDFLFD